MSDKAFGIPLSMIGTSCPPKVQRPLDEVPPPPLVRVARAIVDGWQVLHVDNLTGRLVHDKKVDRALIQQFGIDPDNVDEADADKLAEAPILIKRKRGGPKINPILIDGVTASLIAQVYDAVSPEQRLKFQPMIDRFGVAGLINRLWKIARK